MSEFNPGEPEQLYFARILPDAEDTASYDPPADGMPAPQAARNRTEETAYEGFTPNEPQNDPAPVYDAALFASNEPSGTFAPVRGVRPEQDPAPVYDASLFTPNEPERDPAPVYDASLFTSNEPSGAYAAAPAAPLSRQAEPVFPEPSVPPVGGKVYRGALYAALKTEAGLNTDMLEPVPAGGRAPIPEPQPTPVQELPPAPVFLPETAAAPAVDEEAPDGAADVWIEAAPPRETVQPGMEKRAANPAAARAAVYADLKTEAGLNTDLTEPLHPDRVRAMRAGWVAAPAPESVQPAATAEAVPTDATRPYPPLQGDEPTKIAPPLKRSRSAAQPEAPKAPVTPPTAAVPYHEMPMNENDLKPTVPSRNQPPVQTPAPADAMQEPAPERAMLAANLSAYYRRAAGAPARGAEDVDMPASSVQPVIEDGAAGNVYRPREASWAQEERRTMLGDEEAFTYQVRTEENSRPAGRRRKKRLIRRAVIIGIIAVLLVGVVLLYLSHRPKEEPVGPEQTPVVTATPKPIRGYDASAAIPVSDTADNAIAQISADVEMTPCAVTNHNVLSRSLREDGLYDFYLFSADGTLLGYYDGLKADGMCPMQNGGFYVDMPPYLVTSGGEAMVSLAGLETTLRHTFALRPFMNGWSRIVADDGESNFIDSEGNLLSRLWFCRSFSMTGTESVAYVDTGVLQSPTRYTLYLVNAADASTRKWKDAADDRLVVTAQLGMAYLQSGELYRIADLIADPEGLPLCVTEQVRFYLDCNAMVVKDAASGKYALYVNGKQLYDAVYDSILPVESDVRWKGDILPGDRGQAMVLTITGASYPQPMSYYFTLTRDGVEEHVALSAVTNCPILPD